MHVAANRPGHHCTRWKLNIVWQPYGCAQIGTVPLTNTGWTGRCTLKPSATTVTACCVPPANNSSPTFKNKLSSQAHDSTTLSSLRLQSIVRCNQWTLHWQHVLNYAFGTHVRWHFALWGPTCSFSCLSQKGHTWSLQSNGSALFYSPVHWINLQSKGLPPCEILWAQSQHLIWACNWTELKHFCTQLKSSKWLFLQFKLPPVATAWTEKCSLKSCSFREFAKGCPAIPRNPQWTFSVFAKWIILQSSGSRHSELMLEYSWSLNTYHLSWTLVNFQVGNRITSHFGISKLASGCSHTAAVPPANR